MPEASSSAVHIIPNVGIADEVGDTEGACVVCFKQVSSQSQFPLAGDKQDSHSFSLCNEPHFLVSHVSKHFLQSSHSSISLERSNAEQDAIVGLDVGLEDIVGAALGLSEIGAKHLLLHF